jgi:uncharacterized protein
MTESLPLFPLNSVLHPGGWLDLRIFETRYLDLVRDCSREGRGFGVVLIIDGGEVGAPAEIHALGCEAVIVDFSTLPNGLLGIRVEGRRRFRVHESQVQANGLRVAEVAFLPVAEVMSVPSDYAVLATIVERLAEHGDDQLRSAAKARFDDADWVAWRVLERLPLSPPEKQAALAIDDPLARLQWLLEQLPRFQAE